MPNLTCYMFKESSFVEALDRFDQWVETKRDDQTFGPVALPGFRAKLYLRSELRPIPSWMEFLDEAFEDTNWRRSRSTSAVLVVELDAGGWFGFSFGPAGRFLLRTDRIRRSFGLRTALNLLSRSDDSSPSIQAVQVSRPGYNTRKSQQQVARGSTLDEFELDSLRDIFRAATGRPADAEAWGKRVTGGAAVHTNIPIAFSELGDFCENLKDAYTGDAYKAQFAWIDYFQPVDDPEELRAVEAAAIQAFKAEDWDHLTLAPPEVIDWRSVRGFHYHIDRKPRGGSYVVHPELRIQDYHRGLRDDLADVDADYLRRRRIDVRDGDDGVVGSWAVWEWLSGTVALDSSTYVLDSGESYSVDRDFLNGLDAELDAIALSSLPFPPSKPGSPEPEYAQQAAQELAPAIVLDTKLVHRGGGQKGVELCDLVTANGSFVHLKRGFTSRMLSHLFAQTAGAGELLVMDGPFRERARALISARSSDPAFLELLSNTFDPRDTEWVFGIIADWRGRPPSAAVPFLSKVTLRNSTRRLRSLGYKHSVARIEVGNLT